MNQAVSATTRLDRVVSFLGVWRHELPAVAWSFAYFFCILSAYFLLRPVRDAMAIVSGVLTIPALFTGTFAVMVLVTPAFGWIASRFPRKQFLPWVYYFFVSNILIFFGIFTYTENAGIDQLWVSRAFFVWLSVFNLFVVTVFWSFMADIWSKEQSRRLFGVISAGGSTGALLGPIAASMLVVPIGFRNLLPISALILLLGVVCIYRLRHWVRTLDSNEGVKSIESTSAIGGHALEGIRAIFTKPYFGAIACMLIMANFVGVATYTFLADLVGKAYATTDQQIQVFGWIDGTINFLSFIGQLLLVKHSVKKLGIGVTLALLPVVSAVGFALLALDPVFAVMAVLQIVRRTLTFSFAKPASDMLYAVVSPEEKYKVKNFIDTAVYRTGDLVAVWCIRWISGIGMSGVALVCVPIAIVWAGVAMWIGREYQRLDAKADLTIAS